MTKEAQNCLLKTLEEPPEYATIILVSSNEHKLLTTIKSRCTKVHFSKLSNNEVLQYFSGQTINPIILKVCDGSIGKALKLKDESSVYLQLDSILNSLENSDIIDIWNNSEILYKSKEKINDLLDYMNVYFMNKLLESTNQKYIESIKIVEQAKTRLASNANYDMSIDNILLRIWEEFNEEYSRS